MKTILMTPKETASMLAIKEATLAIWRSNGRYDLKYVKIGRYIRYRLRDIENWINSREIIQ